MNILLPILEIIGIVIIAAGILVPLLIVTMVILTHFGYDFKFRFYGKDKDNEEE